MVSKETMKVILDYIDENIHEQITIEKLAEVSSYSAPHFFRLFFSYMDMTPMNYVLRRKLYFAAKKMVTTKHKVVDIAYDLGFDSHDVFSRAFKRYYGVSPITFRGNSNKLNDFYSDNAYCISDYAIPITLQNQNSPNQDCDIYEERIYIPIQPMNYEIKNLELCSGFFYKAVAENGSKAKEEAFSVMTMWAKNNDLFENEEVRFQVYYGNVDENNIFCEVFYPTNDLSNNAEAKGVKTKTYLDGTYFYTSSVHHFLEPNNRAIWRFIEQDEKLSFSNSEEPFYRPYYEEYRLKEGKLDMYTAVDLYVRVKVKE